MNPNLHILRENYPYGPYPGRVHSNVRLPKTPRDIPNLVDRICISTPILRRQKMGPVPAFSAQFRKSRFPSTYFSFLLLADAESAAIRNPCVVAMTELRALVKNHALSSKAERPSDLHWKGIVSATDRSNEDGSATNPPPQDATVSGLERGALKDCASRAGEKNTGLKVRCCHNRVCAEPRVRVAPSARCGGVVIGG